MKNNYSISMLIDKVEMFWIPAFYIFLPSTLVLLGLIRFQMYSYTHFYHKDSHFSYGKRDETKKRDHLPWEMTSFSL